MACLYVSGEICERCGCTRKISMVGCVHADKHAHLTCMSCGHMFTTYRTSYFGLLKNKMDESIVVDDGKKDESMWWKRD
jgi:hypothetical protein